MDWQCPMKYWRNTVAVHYKLGIHWKSYSAVIKPVQQWNGWLPVCQIPSSSDSRCWSRAASWPTVTWNHFNEKHYMTHHSTHATFTLRSAVHASISKERITSYKAVFLRDNEAVRCTGWQWQWKRFPLCLLATPVVFNSPGGWVPLGQSP